MEIAFFIAMVLFAAISVYRGHMLKKKRQADLSAWALKNEFSFDPSSQGGLEQRFPAFDCLMRGDDRYAYNVITGKWKERPFTCFDYHYKTESRDSKGRRRVHHHHFSGAIVYSTVPLQRLTIRPEGLFDKIGSAFGYEDINFESSEFSRKFHVKAADRKWAFDVLHARAIEHILQFPVYSVTMDWQAALAYRDSLVEVPDLEKAMDLLVGVFNLLPQYVIEQQKAISPPPLV